MAKKKADEEHGIGHNTDIATGKLKSFVSRIEKLNKDKDDVSDDLREVYSEAKSSGLSAKTIRTIVRERAMDVEKRREENELLDLYRAAVGLIDE